MASSVWDCPSIFPNSSFRVSLRLTGGELGLITTTELFSEALRCSALSCVCSSGGCGTVYFLSYCTAKVAPAIMFGFNGIALKGTDGTYKGVLNCFSSCFGLVCTLSPLNS